MDPCTVIIGGQDVLPALKQRASGVASANASGNTAGSKSELLAFADGDALIALEVITKRRPGVVVLEKQFGGTPRGTALINRIKADPSLEQVEIRVMAHDSDFSRVVPRTAAGSDASAGGSGGGTATVKAPAPAAAPAAPLDQRGTRRAPRFKIQGIVEILIDGNTALVIDLSRIGAQVVSPTILKPNQRVRVALADDLGNVRFNASVAWAAFEIPPKTGPRYRAGLEFVDAELSAVDAFCARHKQG
jgi:hypothetical protein